jgi:hypothetical protein
VPLTVTWAENEPPLTPTGWAPLPVVVDQTVDLISPVVQEGSGVGEAGDEFVPSPHVLLTPATSTTAPRNAPVRQGTLTSHTRSRTSLRPYSGLLVDGRQPADGRL